MSSHLLQDYRRAGVYHLPAHRRAALSREASQCHFRALTADVAKATSLPQVLLILGQDLTFPAWYGNNLDALYDCLTDPDWQPGHGYLIHIAGLDSLHRNAPEDLGRLLEVFAAAVDTRRDSSVPFWIALDHPAPDIPAFPGT